MAHYNRKHFFCTLEYCNKKHYARGYCKSHYQQLKRMGSVSPIINWKEVDYPDCEVKGCTAKSTVKKGGLCSTHQSRKWKGKPLDAPPKFKKGAGYTENGRICRVCKVEKPLTEFYLRNQWNRPDTTCRSTVCKDCYIEEVRRWREARLAREND